MRRDRSPIHPAAAQPRPRRRTPGGEPGKLPDIAVCPDCGASYRKGRWTWQAAPADAQPHRCAACTRIAARDPAGVLRVEGAFAGAHRAELIHLVRNIEKRERDEHPMKRVMCIDETADAFVVETTDAKLARSLGRALHAAYAGALEEPPTTADVENLVRVRWTRD